MTAALPEGHNRRISGIADLSHGLTRICAILRSMRGLRQFMRTRSSGGLVAVCVAYSLAIQALMMSVGLGMSAAAAPGQAGYVLCGFTAGASAPAPWGDPQQPRPRPQCPFCFVAAQSAGHIATIYDGPAVPGYVGIPISAGLSDHFAARLFVPRFRRMVGDPRAPPSVSV